ncbi:hypothetical protein N7478_012456 [Penicillium angulare]|uniref:uncharacterized protein n=1 Tax=Penicillium angulare TaxID=116970 RepID=UPI002540DCD6|nr:uncharacterized protein N7478_012456 [Penicillium angulare]KAJ5259475.1 hypothetical protein N7478_012456 [Penicillium angulare]
MTQPSYRWGLNMLPLLVERHTASTLFDFDNLDKNIKALDRLSQTDDFIAPYMGEELSYQSEAQALYQDLFFEELPQVISQGKPVDAVYLPSWCQLVQRVPAEDWKEVKTDGHVNPDDPRYRCHLDGQMIQVTQKQMRTLGWLQANYSNKLNVIQHQSIMVDNRVAKKLAISFNNLSKNCARIADVLTIRGEAYDKDLGMFPWPEHMPNDSVNSTVFHPGGDVPYRSPRSHTDEGEKVNRTADTGEEEGEVEEVEGGEREGEGEVYEGSDDGYTEGETGMVEPHEQTRRSSSRVRRLSSRARLYRNGNTLNDEPPHKRARTVKSRRSSQATSSQASRISDIPLATKSDIVEFTRSEAKHTFNFLIDLQNQRLNWTQIEQEYFERFKIVRSQQWLRSYIKQINDYVQSHPGAFERISPTEGISPAHQIYLGLREQRQ